MKTLGAFLALALGTATLLLAQGPPPGGGMRGPRSEGPGMRGLMGMGPGSQTPVTGAPYSAVETTDVQQALTDGNQIVRHNQTKVYRDSQGRVRQEHTFTPPNSTTPETRITIFDPVAGFAYVLNPTDQTAFKRPIHLRQGTTNSSSTGTGMPEFRGHAGGAAQTQTTDLGTKVVNGVNATGTRTTITIPAGAIGNQQAIQSVREVWISADLKVPVQITSTDPRFGNSTMNLTGVAQAEPDAALFQVPSNYTVTMGRGAGMRRGPGGTGGMGPNSMRPDRGR